MGSVSAGLTTVFVSNSIQLGALAATRAEDLIGVSDLDADFLPEFAGRGEGPLGMDARVAWTVSSDDVFGRCSMRGARDDRAGPKFGITIGVVRGLGGRGVGDESAAALADSCFAPMLPGFLIICTNTGVLAPLGLAVLVPASAVATGPPPLEAVRVWEQATDVAAGFVGSTLIPRGGIGGASFALTVCTGVGGGITEPAAGVTSGAAEDGLETAVLARMLGVGREGLGWTGGRVEGMAEEEERGRVGVELPVRTWCCWRCCCSCCCCLRA